MTASLAWIDGRIVPADEPQLFITDRGFQLGDGVFETLRARRGVAIEFDEHIARLRENAEVLSLPVPPSDAVFADAIADLLRACAMDGLEPPGDAAIRITLSRGPMERRGLLPPGFAELAGTLVVQAWPFAPPPAAQLEAGLSAIVSALRRDPGSPTAGVKSTSRADSVYAKIEAQRRGADDAIFLTLDGDVSEATTANVFEVRGDELATPPLSAAILPGTTRTWLIANAARLGLNLREAPIRPDELAAADEAFVSSSVAGVVPITRLEGQPIGPGRPGPVTLRLRAAREAWIDEVSLREASRRPARSR